MRIIFFGSDDFALVNFRRLIESGFSIVAAVTPPDRPKGRGMNVVAPPVKILAQDHGIPVLQPADLRDEVFLRTLRELAADIFVVIAYGRFLPREVLDIPGIMAVNVHGSLLPKYRGAAPINWAIMNGETETGVTVFKLNPQMDAGEIVRQERIPIDSKDTSVSLRLKMAALSADVLDEALADIEQGQYTLTPQDDAAVTFAPILKRENGLINWSRPATELRNLVRGLLPWPSAYTTAGGKRLKVLAAAESGSVQKAVPGTVTDIHQDGIVVATGRGALKLFEVQPESGRSMDAASFARGHRLAVGDRLGG